VPPLRIASDPAEERVSVKVTAIHLVINGVKFLRGQSAKLPVSEAHRLESAGLVWLPKGSGVDWWAASGRVLAAEPCTDVPLVSCESAGALKIAQTCGYDPGNAVYRFHSAVNEHTPHASAFVTFRSREGNPFRCPEQYNGLNQKQLARTLLYEADVLHQHVDYFAKNVALGLKPRREQVLIRHYHGSLPNGAKQHPHLNQELDDAVGAALVGARLTLCSLRPGRIAWLPIAVPVARYQRLVGDRQRGKVFRVAHSATKDEYKGTADLLAVVDELRASGLPIEVVLIGYKRTRRGRVEPDRRSHAEALRLKASCDCTLDSLHWLGLQGSGIEAATMGQPALAGDETVADLYREHLGEVPYTHVEGQTSADRKRSLKRLLEQLATDSDFYAAEASRVSDYCLQYHDYPAVAARYQEILTWAADWENLDLPKFPAPTPERDTPVRRIA
jgi:hypothetical protein